VAFNPDCATNRPNCISPRTVWIRANVPYLFSLVKSVAESFRFAFRVEFVFDRQDSPVTTAAEFRCPRILATRNYVFPFGIWELGIGVWGLGFGNWDLGFGVWDSIQDPKSESQTERVRLLASAPDEAVSEAVL